MRREQEQATVCVEKIIDSKMEDMTKVLAKTASDLEARVQRGNSQCLECSRARLLIGGQRVEV